MLHKKGTEGPSIGYLGNPSPTFAVTESFRPTWQHLLVPSSWPRTRGPYPQPSREWVTALKLFRAAPVILD